MSFPPAHKLSLLPMLPIVELYQLDLTTIQKAHVPADPDIILYFTPQTQQDEAEAEGNYRETRLDGIDYTPVPVELTGLQRGGDGPVAQPTIRVSNATRVFGAFLLDYGDMLGAVLTRTVISEAYLDYKDDLTPFAWNLGEPDSWFDQQTYIVEQKTSQTPAWVEWRLRADIDIESRKVPGRKQYRICRHRYRVLQAGGSGFNYDRVTCPYTGTKGYTRHNVLTAVEAEDTCSKTLAGCKIRFPLAPFLSQPIDGLPGLGSKG